MSNPADNDRPDPLEPAAPHEPGSSVQPVIGPSTTVFVMSPDAVWARLVAQNLAARGVNVRHCLPDDLHDLHSVVDHGGGGWLVVDTDDQSPESRELLKGVVQVLRNASVKTLAVVDSMAGHAQLLDLDVDAIVSRTADMRVQVRKLLRAFTASPIERAVAALQSEW